MNVDGWNSRTITLLGEEAVEKLANSRVLVVGLGGVGGYAAEMLARSGVGHLTIIDADDVDISNLNRQLVATRSSVGMLKTELFKSRFRDINPDIEVIALPWFVTVDNIEEILSSRFDYVVDAIDTVAPKVALISYCLRKGVPVISSMGAGGRTDPTKVIVTDLSSTRDDGLAKAVRQRLKKAGIRKKLEVVFSTEVPHPHSIIDVNTQNKRTSLGTIACVPSVFGIYMASKVLERLIK